MDLLYESDVRDLRPAAYRYTAPDGTVYLINKSTGLESVDAPPAQRLTFGPERRDAHYRRQGLTFVRDAQGRITEISDPDGNVRTLRLRRDRRPGQLHRCRGQRDHLHSTTSAHRLLEIIDPRGVQAIRNEYDDDRPPDRPHRRRRARRSPTTTTWSPSTETVTDRRGNSTVYEYDDRGNVLRKTDALGDEHPTTPTTPSTTS